MWSMRYNIEMLITGFMISTIGVLVNVMLNTLVIGSVISLGGGIIMGTAIAWIIFDKKGLW